MEQERYKISVIVPVYNKEPYLERGVRSLLAQTYRNLEILLIDDGSQDRSGDICDALAKQDPRIRVIHKENEGLVPTWMRGVREAVGDYLNFMDSDDWVDPEMLADMAGRLNGGPREIVACSYVMERSGGKQQFVRQKLPEGEFGREALEKEVHPYLLGEEKRYLFVSRCMKLFSRRLICDNMLFCDPKIGMGEDISIVIPALLDCERLVVLDRAYYHYRYVETSMVHDYDRGLFENIQRLRAVIIQIVQTKYGSEKQQVMRRRADQEYILLLLLVVKNEVRGNPKGYAENIRRVAEEPEIRELVRSVPVTIHAFSNRLLYAALRHPNFWILRLLRLVMVLYYACRCMAAGPARQGALRDEGEV